jgi:aquaporin Z
MQCIGAIFASMMLLAIMSGLPGYDIATSNLGANGYGEDYLGGFSLTSAFITEVITTFIFLMVIFGATSSKASPERQ